MIITGKTEVYFHIIADMKWTFTRQAVSSLKLWSSVNGSDVGKDVGGEVGVCGGACNGKIDRAGRWTLFGVL